MKRILLMVFCSSFSLLLFGQDTIRISNDLLLIPIERNTFIHVSYLPAVGNEPRVACNGLLFADQGQGYLFDAPISDSITRILVHYLREKMYIGLLGCVVTDWHIDNIGGVKALIDEGIPCFANEKTVKIAEKKKIAHLSYGFKDSMTLSINEKLAYCYYPGEGHTKDGIVIWIPKRKVLFGGCLIKGMASADLGYTADANLKAYAATVKKVKAKFPDVKLVVPGHGAYGGPELIDHTLQMAETIRKK